MCLASLCNTLPEQSADLLLIIFWLLVVADAMSSVAVMAANGQQGHNSGHRPCLANESHFRTPRDSQQHNCLFGPKLATHTNNKKAGFSNPNETFQHQRIR